MRKHWFHILLVVVSACLLFTGCGSKDATKVAGRGKAKFRNWLRYEFKQLKTFSYGSSQVKENLHVIGYEPSWLIYDSLYLSYPFELLSDLVVGEYDLNPSTGFARNDSSLAAFRSKDIIQMATNMNGQLNVLLALTDYGDFAYRNAFLNELAKKNLLNTLDVLLDELNELSGGGEERKKVGLLLDFPEVPWSLRYEYAEFIARIKKDLDNRELGKSCLVYVVLPPVEDKFVLYKDSLFSARVRENTDLFLIRAHNFEKEVAPGIRGVMMPIERPGKLMDLDSLVKYYSQTGHIPRNRMTVEFPYYGKYWSSDTTISGSRPLLPLNEIFNTVKAERLIDTSSYSFKRMVASATYYYQDTLTLSLAYNWILKNKLAGVGLYGLGYAQGIDDPALEQGLWQIVAENFAEPAPRLLFPGVGFLLCFLGIGIMGSAVMNWEVRFALREKRGKLWYYFALCLCIILAVVLCALPLEIVPIFWKLLSLVLILVFPLGRKAFKYLTKTTA